MEVNVYARCKGVKFIFGLSGRAVGWTLSVNEMTVIISSQGNDKINTHCLGNWVQKHQSDLFSFS